jgi:2-desacetyl-2-hydroxyethyl bacteriochlorophyllide A dehydrogenase
MTMRAGRILAPHRAEVTVVPVPTPGPGEVLIRVARAGICGTDLHILAGDYGLAKLPLTVGHEFAGTIAALGPGVEHLAVGERVTADPNIACGRCPECQRGARNQCSSLEAVGVTRDGAIAQYVLAAAHTVVLIGDLSFEAAALAEPLACVVWGLSRVRVQPGEAAVVFGAGPMGCLIVQALKAAGASPVAVVDLSSARLARATTVGADIAIGPHDMDALRNLAPVGFDLVVEATGVPQVLEQCIDLARPGGTVWVFGVAPTDAIARVSPYTVFRKELSLVGSFALNQTLPRAVHLIRSGAIRTAPLVTHVLTLDDFADALLLAHGEPRSMKIQITFEGACP